MKTFAEFMQGLKSSPAEPEAAPSPEPAPQQFTGESGLHVRMLIDGEWREIQTRVTKTTPGTGVTNGLVYTHSSYTNESGEVQRVTRSQLYFLDMLVHSKNTRAEVRPGCSVSIDWETPISSTPDDEEDDE